MTFVRIWRFRAAPGRAGAFEAAYGANGDWARLFSRAAGYLGTELLRAVYDGESYLTIDRWESQESWDRFRGEHASEYDELDRRCEKLTIEEEQVGDYRAAKGLLP
ncbi:MAG TPA: antibiotic biosynthesis monooxygenase family protein [Candidatus Krumholzibacteria bacterium]|nr:antibiotic biosynthesis monooxygenase family protein [Candidatus Krumholzibacteria bacterium]